MSEPTTPSEGYLFAPSDLELLRGKNDVPNFLVRATEHLVKMAEEEPEYETGNPLYGRFGFFSYSKTAAETRTVFRIAREALDFLEADYLVCEKKEMEFWGGEADAVARMRAGVAPVVQDSADYEEDGRPTMDYFKRCLEAVSDVYEYARRIPEGTEMDLFCQDEQIISMRSAFAMLAEAITVVESAFNETLSDLAKEHAERHAALFGPTSNQA